MAGRKPKGERDETFDANGTKRTTMRLAPELLTLVAKVRAPGETLTAYAETSMTNEAKRRLRSRRRQPD
jgi:hypothetical protein